MNQLPPTSNPPCPLFGGIVVGIACGALFETSVLIQALGWHQVVSGWYPMASGENLNINRISNGVAQLVAYVLLAVGLFMLLRSSHRYDRWSAACLSGAISIGWGGFNLIESILAHEVLGMHHVNELVSADERFIWDMIMLGSGAAALGTGIVLVALCDTK